ncbi:Protein FAR1-RELATED SEQUENCE 5, partial [Camellia lanceoleosa]
NDGGDCDWKPKVHMTFDTEQEAYNFYNAYGGRMGFSIRRGYVNKNKEGQITSRLFVCNKEGQEVRTGCQARLIIKWDRNIHKFFVGEFVEQHNHIFVPTECTHMLPSQRKISASQASEIDLAEKSGIRLNAAFELMGNEAGGRESLGFTKVDQKNYLRTKRQKSLAYGEAGSILQYFREKTLENPSFFYSDEDDFTLKWEEMLDKYEVRDNHWLKLTFGVKEKWGWPYVRNAWGAGMSSTQLSESFNAFLKDFIQSDHNLMQFFMHFDRVLCEKRYKELQAEYALCQKLPRVNIKVKIMEQAADVYTNKIYEEFQDEYVKSLEVNIEETEICGESTIYTVLDSDGVKVRKVTVESRAENVKDRCGHDIKVD